LFVRASLPGHTSIEELERLKARTVTAEYNFQAMSGLDEAGRQIHQLLHDGPNSATFGRVAHGRFVPC